MKIIVPQELQTLEPLEEKYVPHFVGTTTLRDIQRCDEPVGVSTLLVRFEAGSHNFWHSHSGGQLLYVTEGVGYVQVRGEPIRRIEAGQWVSCPPNEDHWHGAGPNSSMIHIAVTMGETTWRERVEPKFDEVGH